MSVLSYHERTKHRLDRYASGPETLDWSMQPDSFRKYSGTKRTLLPLSSADVDSPSLDSIGTLLRLSMAISAWKEYGPDKWAVRCNPSSGNLHPTECYVISLGIPGMEDGLYHYSVREHCLELRCGISWEGEARLFVGLSTIHWREAWKYGERAFRYCQLDVGHALGALAYAASTFGWRIELIDAPRNILGTERKEDFANAEHEEFELLVEIDPGEESKEFPLFGMGEWAGQANLLDPHPMYAWPVIDETAILTRKQGSLPASGKKEAIRAAPDMANILLQRRSAQQFDPSHVMKLETFMGMVEALSIDHALPWDLWGFAPRVHPVFFIHRVEGLEPGLYVLPRSEDSTDALKKNMKRDFLWEKTGALFLLARADCRKIARIISCHQAIASNSCFSLGMLAEFGNVVSSDPWRYRQLHWEAGLIGHVLYLEAEKAGLRGTGIGCFFDDAFHELLDIENDAFQSIYHFTVGLPMTDTRIATLPPYPERN
jgi:SagB-type dehydrogenase family enzyme